MASAGKTDLLIVEDDQELLRILKAVINKLNVNLHVAVTVRQGLQMLDEVRPSILLLDMKLPDGPGLDVIKELKRRGVACTIIVITAHGSVETAVEAMREGAYDFLTKPLDLDRLLIMVDHAIERHRLINELQDFSENFARVRFRYLFGASPAMQRLYTAIQTNAPGGAPVLLLGPEGSEFRDVALSIHEQHKGSNSSFVAVTPEQVGSEEADLILFGTDNEGGLFHAASGGTLFIEKIHALTKSAQSSLLNYLQTGTLPNRRKLSTGHEPRLICWSHGNHLKEAQEEQFSSDLYYALATIQLSIPPLRDRGDDVLQFAQRRVLVESHLQGKLVARLDDEVEEALMRYHWPGNLDELNATIGYGVQRCKGATLRLDHLPIRITQLIERNHSPELMFRGTSTLNVIRPLRQTEQAEIEKALKLCNGNVLEAARLLEVPPSTIYRKQRLWANQ